MYKNILYILLGITLVINLTLGFRYARRYFIQSDFTKCKLIDKTQKLETAYPLFKNSLNEEQRNKFNYIVFLDSAKFYSRVQKLNYLDSLAYYHPDVNFIVATEGDNDFITDYLEKYDLRYKHLTLLPRTNYLQSAICNKLTIGYKGFNCDLLLDANGEIIYNPRLVDQGNRKNLEKFLSQLKVGAWQKVLN